MFVLPPARPLADASRVADQHCFSDQQCFSDQRYHGEILSTAFNKLVVSEKNKNLDAMTRKIQASLDLAKRY